MTKIAIVGCNGKMGYFVAQSVNENPETEVLFGVDAFGSNKYDFDVFKSFDEADKTPDVIIDFSSPKVLDALLAYATEKNVPVVLCTTGFSDEQIEQIKAASTKVAILKSANMSLGINTIIEMLKTATSVFYPAGFDVEIVEQHHHNKLDAPSGTALALADAINDAAGGDMEYIYDRSQRREKRDAKELGISAVRGGSIPGTHDVIFAGQDEVIELRHIAYSRSIFGNGAVSAAKFLKGKSAGMYTMAEVIADAISK